MPDRLIVVWFYCRLVFWWVASRLWSDRKIVSCKRGVLDSASKHCHYCLSDVGLPHWSGCPCVGGKVPNIRSLWANDIQVKRDAYSEVSKAVRGWVLGNDGKDYKKYGRMWLKAFVSHLNDVIGAGAFIERVYVREGILSISWVHAVSTTPLRRIRKFRL